MKIGKSVFNAEWHSGKPIRGIKVNRDGCTEIGAFKGAGLVSGAIWFPDGGEKVIVRANRGFIKFSISGDVDMKVKIDEGTRLSKKLVKEFVKNKSVEKLKQTDEVKLIRKL
jgi:hypothetical protein